MPDIQQSTEQANRQQPPATEGAGGSSSTAALRGADYASGATAVRPGQGAGLHPGYQPGPTAAAVQAGARLRLGHSGSLVTKVQQLLGISADGLFGMQTEGAVRAYQQRTGLTPVSGVVGPTTLEHMTAGGFPSLVGERPAQREAQPQQGAPPAAEKTVPDPPVTGQVVTDAPDRVAAPTLPQIAGGATLERGHQGEAVAEVQRLLGIPQTGTFGDETAHAVKAFQRTQGLTPASGIVGNTTLDKLRAVASAQVSPEGAKQMERLVAYADSHHQGASLGDCFMFVWRYMVAVGYGKIRNHNDAPDMPSGYARNFAEYMNSGNNAARWGIKRLSISNPYDAPRGAIVVVAPGTPGTRHRTAGDIAVAAGGGRFINDGPNMRYGDPGRFTQDGGRVLGVYVPAI